MGVDENLKEIILGAGFYILWFIVLGSFLSIIFSKRQRQKFFSTHNFIAATLTLASFIFWVGLILVAFEIMDEWWIRIVIIILLLNPILVNLYFLQMIEEKGLMFALKNFDRPFKLLGIQIKGKSSQEDGIIEIESLFSVLSENIIDGTS